MAKISIIASKGSLDGLMPALILARGAKERGHEVSVFFTFFGLEAIIKSRQNSIGISPLGNPALRMPGGAKFPSLLGILPGVGKLISWFMKKTMKKLNYPTIQQLVQALYDFEVDLYACRAAMEMFGIKEKELIPECSGILSVGDFFELAEDGKIIFT